MVDGNMGIIYKKGYKYQLCKEYSVYVQFSPTKNITTEYIDFTVDGLLIIKKGYAWDGPTNPAPDLKALMRPSLIHDALYQLCREGYLDHHIYRKLADFELRRAAIESGMLSTLAETVYQAVRIAGGPSADPSQDKLLQEAP